MKIGIGFSNYQLLKKIENRNRVQQLPIAEKNVGIEQVIDSERKKFPLPHTTKKILNKPTAQPATRLRTRMLLIKSLENVTREDDIRQHNSLYSMIINM